MFNQVTSRPSVIRRSAAAVAVAALLIGCSGGSDDDASDTSDVVVDTTEAPSTTEVTETTDAPSTTEVTETTDAPSTTEVTETTDATAPDGTVPEDVLTEPGTELALGDTAIVTIDTDLPDEHVAFTVDAMREGTSEELAELQVPDVPAGAKVWYVDFTVTNVSAAETGGDYLPSTGYQFGILSADDTVFVPIIKFVAFAPCENEDTVDLAIGESSVQCQIFLAEGGEDADRAVFTPDFSTAPISWR